MTVNSLPADPSLGEMFVIDSTSHVVERNSVGSDDVGTDSPHEAAFSVVEPQDELGIGTKQYRWNNCHKQEKKNVIPAGVQ